MQKTLQTKINIPHLYAPSTDSSYSVYDFWMTGSQRLSSYSVYDFWMTGSLRLSSYSVYDFWMTGSHTLSSYMAFQSFDFESN